MFVGDSNLLEIRPALAAGRIGGANEASSSIFVPIVERERERGKLPDNRTE